MSCYMSCYIWIKSHMPFHHIFALIHHNLITWDYLLKSYRERNNFIIDNDFYADDGINLIGNYYR